MSIYFKLYHVLLINIVTSYYYLLLLPTRVAVGSRLEGGGKD